MNIYLILLFLVHQSSGVIYTLNLTEYYKMPELYQMDDYDHCLVDPGGLYCLLDLDLYPGDNPDLMWTIQEYSEYEREHYNHTQIHRAVCVTKSCKDFIQNRSLENAGDLQSTLEECLNASIWQEYQLTARVTNILPCKKHGTKTHFSTGDYVMAAVYLILIILNTMGTLHDYLKGETPGIPFLLAFSVPKNWQKLTAPSNAGSEYRLQRLKAMNAIRSLTMCAVFSTHTALAVGFSYLKNPLYFETAYDGIFKNVLLQGPIITYTFLMMSGFLVALNVQLQAEKRKITFWDWPKGLVLRWLRLTPVLALVLFTIMTLNRHLGDGPQWDLVVMSEVEACHKYWWAHLLYVNNYIYDDSHCLPQAWYLAADTQLFALGLLLMVVCRRLRTQIWALIILSVASVAISISHIYLQNMDAVPYQSPEYFRSVYKTYDTFRIMYIGAHTNMFSYIVGLGGGLLAFNWFKNEKAVTAKYQKYSWTVWVTVVSGFVVTVSSAFFYIDGYEPSMTTKLLFGTLQKPIFQLVVLGTFLGTIFKAEGIIRGVLEWRGFTWTARVSYSAFLLHSVLQRWMVGMQRSPTYATDISLVMMWAGTAFLSNTGAAILWLTVEAPLAAVVKNSFFPPRRESEPKRQETIVDETTKV